jgi:hypothetical protein
MENWITESLGKIFPRDLIEEINKMYLVTFRDEHFVLFRYVLKRINPFDIWKEKLQFKMKKKTLRGV